MRLAFYGPVVEPNATVLGPLAVLAPLLERMNVAEIIDRHLPADPQREYAHGTVLRALLAARLCQPTALVNVADWAATSGLEFLWGIPPDKLNDDRLGRALDALFEQRHSILAGVAAHVLTTFQLPAERLHYDLTDLVLYGAYDTARPIPAGLDLPPATPSADYPPAHITHGYRHKTAKVVNAGLCCVVDDLGAVPIFGHTLGGNHNGQTGIAEQFQLLQGYLELDPLLMVSDRGTFSAAHALRLHQAGHSILCSVPWHEVRALFDRQRPQLRWQRASYLSIEQRRRRAQGSSLPQEHYELAVVRHELRDPSSDTPLPCRVVFVFSTAGQKAELQARERAIAKIRAGLEELARTVAKGHANTRLDRLPARIAKLVGKAGAGRYFAWRLVPLSAEEQATLPPPQRGCRRPTQRLEFTFDAAQAQADAAYDGYSALLTTAALALSADQLFTQFRQQNFVEQAHHQWKTPLAVHPLFLKSPQRVEALVYLLKMALTAYHLLQRLYRQAVPPDAPAAERRLTTETILRRFRDYHVVIEETPIGRVIHPTQLDAEQRRIVNRIGFPSPAQLLSRRLLPSPSS